jgi:predicted ribosome quality control (RQC) complex YloA/Tae2 family protein
VRDGEAVVVYAPYPVTHRGEPIPAASISQAIEAYTASAVSVDPYAAAKRPVAEALASARARLERREQALERALKQSEAAETWRRSGEWILAYAHTIKPGQEELVAETGSGEVARIALDPGLSAADNAQAYFARYRKAQRATEGSPARLEEVRLALRDLEQLETDLALAADRPQIEEVRSALVEAGYARSGRDRPGRGKGRVRAASPRSGPLALTSVDGLPILVGRNSRQNDLVTFRRAKGEDWWFHARGVPGAHVIVRSGAGELPAGTIRQAAQLAGYFSASRGEARVAVDYTRRRHVRRIRGAAPGLVTYSQERTVRVRPRGPGDAPEPGGLGQRGR